MEILKVKCILIEYIEGSKGYMVLEERADKSLIKKQIFLKKIS